MSTNCFTVLKRPEPKGGVDASSEVPDEDYVVPIGQAVVRRQGKDVTIVGTLLMMHRAFKQLRSPPL